MTKVDNSYMERLEEVLFDDKKVINYKGVSVMLGVHVNIAKQMLYHFYKCQKEKGKPIYATYFVSGMLPRKMLSEFRGDSSGGGGEEQTSISDELDAFLVLICRDSDLERYKAKFTKIFSIHIYALSGFQLENFDPLKSLAEEKLSDSEGRTPVDFGPITCKAAQKFRETIRVPPPAPSVNHKEAPKAKKEERSQSQKLTTDKKTDTPEESKDETPAKVQKKTTTIVAPGKNDKDRLKNMFATAASKPKVKKEEKQKMEVDEDEKESKSNSRATSQSQKSSKSSTVSKSKSNGDSRKRKRIRDVLSSDSEEDDDEDKKSEKEEDSDSPESPLPKRMQRVIESDSEDEDFKEKPAKKVEQNSTPASASVPVVPKSGKIHVTKTVKKTYVDKDGYLVTTREKVVVSEDEEEAGAPLDKSTPKDIDNNNSDTPPAQNESKKKVNPPPKPKSTQEAPGKTKQASLMSFFKKK